MSFGKTQATSLIPRNFSIFCDNNVFDVLQLYFELLFLKSIVAITKLLFTWVYQRWNLYFGERIETGCKATQENRKKAGTVSERATAEITSAQHGIFSVFCSTERDVPIHDDAQKFSLWDWELLPAANRLYERNVFHDAPYTNEWARD